jgi:hypothetical protein
MSPNHWDVMDASCIGDRSGRLEDAEVAAGSIPDKRLQRRLRRLLEQLSAAPGTSIPAACGDWAATKATYRFFDNPRFTEHGVLSGHCAATAARAKASVQSLFCRRSRSRRGKVRLVCNALEDQVFHKGMKSSCRAEDAELQTAERLVKLLALITVVSWRISWITMSARAEPLAKP